MGNILKFCLAMVCLLVFGQQCSRVPLERLESIGFESKSSNPFLIPPPTEFPVVRRYILLVDMSNSMISGPCQNDVEGGIYFPGSGPFSVYDPTKGVGRSDDHRADGIDCRVNDQLVIEKVSLLSNVLPNIKINPPIFYETYPGIDFSGSRIEIVKTWLADLLNNSTPEMLNNTKIMLIPVSGGVSQAKLASSLGSVVGISDMFKFIPLSDSKVMAEVEWLKQEHMRNYSLVRSSDIWRYETTKMGTTAPGALLSSIYDSVTEDMRELNHDGLLSYADYDVVHLSDGFLSPQPDSISKVLKFYQPCAACAADSKNCVGICSTLVKNMETAWGVPSDNSLDQLDFKLGLLQSLPQFFGAGNLRMNFVQLYKARSLKARPGETTYFDDLIPYFKKRNSRFSLWQADSEKPPFQLLGSYRESVTYKMTDIFLLNPNVRADVNGQLQIDSDGDGLFDNEEIALGTDPHRARTNGYCLDSFMAHEAYASRCKAMVASRSCDPTLDSDGDGLNECEEMLLGTDPFDFDTDGDGIPDLYEWIYGYNPLSGDVEKDNNGDGFTNMYNFARGLGPVADVQRLTPTVMANYDVNFLGREKMDGNNARETWVESYQVILKNLPVMEMDPTDESKQVPMFASRVSDDPHERDANLISAQDSLLSYPTVKFKNKMVGLMRLVDRDNPDRIFWRIFKADIPVTQSINQPQLDLTKFHLIRARDRGM